MVIMLTPHNREGWQACSVIALIARAKVHYVFLGCFGLSRNRRTMARPI